MQEEEIPLHPHNPIDRTGRDQRLPWMTCVYKHVSSLCGQQRRRGTAHADRSPVGTRMHFDIPSFAIHACNEVDDSKFFRRSERHQVCRQTVCNLNATLEPTSFRRSIRRTRAKGAVKIAESCPEANVVRFDAKEGVHYAIPIARFRTSIHTGKLAE